MVIAHGKCFMNSFTRQLLGCPSSLPWFRQQPWGRINDSKMIQNPPESAFFWEGTLPGAPSNDFHFQFIAINGPHDNSYLILNKM